MLMKRYEVWELYQELKDWQDWHGTPPDYSCVIYYSSVVNKVNFIDINEEKQLYEWFKTLSKDAAFMKENDAATVLKFKADEGDEARAIYRDILGARERYQKRLMPLVITDIVKDNGMFKALRR